MNYSTGLIDLIISQKLEDFNKHYEMLKENNNMVWVSALVQCPRKWMYMLRYPEIARADIKGSFILGGMAHRGLELFLLENHAELGYDRAEAEVDLQKRFVVDGREIIVCGKADIIAYRGEEKIIYEFKTSRSDIGLPHQHHILQLRTYMNIAGTTNGILVYITPDRATEYHITNPLSNEEIEDMIRSFLEYKGPRYEWECNYCPYTFICTYKATKKRT